MTFKIESETKSHRTFPSELDAVLWLLREGYICFGHLSSKLPSQADYDDADDPDRVQSHLQATIWIDPIAKPRGGAVIERGLDGSKWVVTYLSDAAMATYEKMAAWNDDQVAQAIKDKQ